MASIQLAKTQPAASAGLQRGFLQPQEPLSGTDVHFYKHICQTILRLLPPPLRKNKINTISAIPPWCHEAEGLDLTSPKDGAYEGTADGLCQGCKLAHASVTAVFISLYYALNPCGETGAELPAKQRLAARTSDAPCGCREATWADMGFGVHLTLCLSFQLQGVGWGHPQVLPREEGKSPSEKSPSRHRAGSSHL